jgi:L-ascorbate metabolism protein UlaG (beta-lactamase superfamily)
MKRALLTALGVAAVLWTSCSKERIESEETRTPKPAAPSSAASTTDRATDRLATAKGDLVVTPLEHASILFGWDGLAIYVDPSSLAIADGSLPVADVVLVTEDRYDHLDAVAVARLARPGVIVVGPPAVAEKTHVDVVLRGGETREVHGFPVTATVNYGRDEVGRGVGYLLDLGGTRVYVSGDTQCSSVATTLPAGVDVAFVAIKPSVAMTAADAARCIAALHPKVAFPYHDWRVDLSDLERGLAGTDVELRVRDFYPRAQRLREEAARCCDKGLIGVCRDRLDLAKPLDPLGEADPDVIRMRARVRAWQSPFPAWW